MPQTVAATVYFLLLAVGILSYVRGNENGNSASRSLHITQYPQGEDFCPATGCFDEHPLCAEIARNGSCFGALSPEQEARKNDTRIGPYRASANMLMCRISCWQAYIDAGSKDMLSPRDIDNVKFGGGFGPMVLDPFGYPYQVCDLRDGMTLERRSGLLGSHITAYYSYTHNPFQIDRYTRAGIGRGRVPSGLFREILEWRRRRLENSTSSGLEIEQCQHAHHNCYRVEDDGEECKVVQNECMKITRLTVRMKEKILDALKPVAEEWASELSLEQRGERVKVAGSVVYGMRRYERGATLAAHIDQKDTHIISAILNIAQDVDEPWPLEIFDWNKKHNRIYMKPGDMLWYESARLPHGRMVPFNGTYFDNIFVHFQPVGMENKKSFDVFIDTFN